MQIPSKLQQKLKDFSSKGEKVFITVKNHLNQSFVLEGIIPNYYEFKDGRFPNLSVGRDFVILNYGNSHGTKIKLPTPMVAVKKIECSTGVLFENFEYSYDAHNITHWLSEEFGTLKQFSLNNTSNTLAKKYVGKVVSYKSNKIPELSGKQCLITGLTVNPKTNNVNVFINRSYIFTDTKIIIPIEEFEDIFILENEKINEI